MFVVLVGYFNSQVSGVTIEFDKTCEWEVNFVLEGLGKDVPIHESATSIINAKFERILALELDCIRFWVNLHDLTDLDLLVLPLTCGCEVFSECKILVRRLFI